MDVQVNHDRVAVGGVESVGGGLATMRAAVVGDPEDAFGGAVWLQRHDLVDQAPEGLNPGGGLQASKELGAVNIPGGKVSKSAAAVVLVLHAQWPTRLGWSGGLAADAGLDRGLLIRADHVLAGLQGLAFKLAGVEVEDPTGPGRKVGSARKDPAPVPPGSDGVLRQPLPDRGPRDARHQASTDDLGPDVGDVQPG